jgi:hypothetical protein
MTYSSIRQIANSAVGWQRTLVAILYDVDPRSAADRRRQQRTVNQ